MALRLFPFRQYSDHNVINMFANQTVDDNPSTDGQGSAGVIVKVFTDGGVPGGSISKDVIEFASSSSYLGKTDYPFLGADKYPQTPLRVGAATTGVPVLGVTLNQTISNDENGEKLLYNPVKKDELQAVLSGQAVPVATKGLFTFAAGGATSTFSAFGNNTTTVPGNLAVIDSAAGNAGKWWVLLQRWWILPMLPLIGWWDISSLQEKEPLKTVRRTISLVQVRQVMQWLQSMPLLHGRLMAINRLT
jgi:hypothetical protein